MLRNGKRAPFHGVASEMVAAKPVTILGRNYLPGELVDIANLPPRLVKNLYEMRRLDYSATSAKGRPMVAGDILPDAPPPEPEPEASATDEKLELPVNLSMVHRGFGKFYLVDDAGNDIAGPMSKAEASERLAG